MVIVFGIRATHRSTSGSVAPAKGRGKNHFRIAFITAFTNPFTALFFFAAAGGLGSSAFMERATLSGVVFAIAALWFGAVILAALCVQTVCFDGAVAGRALRWGRRAAGLALVAYGLAIIQKAAATLS